MDVWFYRKFAICCVFQFVFKFFFFFAFSMYFRGIAKRIWNYWFFRSFLKQIQTKHNKKTIIKVWSNLMTTMTMYCFVFKNSWLLLCVEINLTTKNKAKKIKKKTHTFLKNKTYFCVLWIFVCLKKP